MTKNTMVLLGVAGIGAWLWFKHHKSTKSVFPPSSPEPREPIYAQANTPVVVPGTAPGLAPLSHFAPMGALRLDSPEDYLSGLGAAKPFIKTCPAKQVLNTATGKCEVLKAAKGAPKCGAGQGLDPTDLTGVHGCRVCYADEKAKSNICTYVGCPKGTVADETHQHCLSSCPNGTILKSGKCQKIVCKKTEMFNVATNACVPNAAQQIVLQKKADKKQKIHDLRMKHARDKASNIQKKCTQLWKQYSLSSTRKGFPVAHCRTIETKRGCKQARGTWVTKTKQRPAHCSIAKVPPIGSPAGPGHVAPGLVWNADVGGPVPQPPAGVPATAVYDASTGGYQVSLPDTTKCPNLQYWDKASGQCLFSGGLVCGDDSAPVNGKCADTSSPVMTARGTSGDCPANSWFDSDIGKCMGVVCPPGQTNDESDGSCTCASGDTPDYDSWPSGCPGACPPGSYNDSDTCYCTGSDDPVSLTTYPDTNGCEPVTLDSFSGLSGFDFLGAFDALALELVPGTGR